MATAQIIQFPKPEMVMECWECDCEVFFLHLDHSTSKTDVMTFAECAECGCEMHFTERKD